MVGPPRPGDTGLLCHGTAPAAHFLCSTAHIRQDIRAAWFCSCGLPWRSDECVSHPCFYAQPDIYAVMNCYVVALFFSSDVVTRSADRSGVSNSNCAVGHMRTYKTTRGRTTTLTQQHRYVNLPETAFTSYFLQKVPWM